METLNEFTNDENGNMHSPPPGAIAAAKKALKYREEHGDEVQAMTQTGWTRARQLANGDKVSTDIVKRMASFARHEKNKYVADEFKSTPWKDRGYVSWLGWGGDAGVNWAKKLSANINESFDKSIPLLKDDSLDSSPAYVLDRYTFDINGKEHVIRAVKYTSSYGKHAMQISVGIQRGRKITTKISGVGNIKEYFATLIKGVEKIINEPNERSKKFSRGVVIEFPEEVWEKFSPVLMRIVKKRTRGKFKVSSHHDVPHSESRKGIYIYKKRYDFNKAFQLKDAVDIPEPSEVDDEDTIIYPGGEEVKDKTDLLALLPASEAPLTTPESTALDAPVKLSQIEKNALIENMPSFEEKSPEEAKQIAYAIKYEKMFRHGVDFSVEEQILGAGASTSIDFPFDGYLFAFLLRLKGYDTRKNYSDNKSRIGAYPVEYVPQKIEMAYGLPNNLGTKKEPVPFDKAYPWMLNFENEMQKELDKHGKTFIKAEVRQHNYIETGSFSTATDEEIEKGLSHLLKTPREFDLTQPAWKIKEQVPGLFQLCNEYLKRASSVDEMKSRFEIMPEAVGKATELGKFWSKEHFQSQFIHTWLLTGGTESYTISGVASNQISVNESLDPNSFWIHGKKNKSGFNSLDLRDEVYNHPFVRSHFQDLYNQTQNFFKEKFGKKYEKKTIKLYRGVGVPNATSYVPAPMESWSTLKSTARKFAKNMSPHGGSGGSVFVSNVPVQYIIMTYQAQSDDWADESELQGEKEHVVLGGAFNEIELKRVDLGDFAIQTFSEWINESESEKDMKTIKIVKPSERDEHTALGVDPKEPEVRGK